MHTGIAARLAALNLHLPPAHRPVATYVGWRRSGRELLISGVGPTWGQDVRFAGRMGKDLDEAAGIAAARLTALNLLAQAADALQGQLDYLAGCLKVFALVNSTAEFVQAHRVADGITDLLVDVLGGNGRPARAAISAPSLPMNIAVEADAVFLLREDAPNHV